MRSFGRLRCASASSCPTISGVAPASASIGPAASASSLGSAPEFNSRPIFFAIWTMAVCGIILDSSRCSLATLRHGATMHSCCWAAGWVAVARGHRPRRLIRDSSNRGPRRHRVGHPRRRGSRLHHDDVRDEFVHHAVSSLIGPNLFPFPLETPRAPFPDLAENFPHTPIYSAYTG